MTSSPVDCFELANCCCSFGEAFKTCDEGLDSLQAVEESSARGILRGLSCEGWVCHRGIVVWGSPKVGDVFHFKTCISYQVPS